MAHDEFAHRRSRLRVAGKLGLVIGLLLALSLGIAVFSQLALARSHDRLKAAYTRFVPLAASSQELGSLLDQVEQNGQLNVTADPTTQSLLTRQMDDVLIPRLRTVRSSLAALEVNDIQSSDALKRLSTALTDYYRLRGVNGFKATDTPGGTKTMNAWTTVQSLGDGLHTHIEAQTADTLRAANASYDDERAQARIATAVALLFGLVAGGLLIRNLVPRLRHSARFASEFAAGIPATELKTSGSDELSDLAHTLTAMVAKRSDEAVWERRQDEFVEALQATSTEAEAHELLQRHLQRSVADSKAVVLQRNNSANRLQAAIRQSPDDELTARLVGAGPRSCLALRLARTHRQTPTEDSLIECSLCGDRDVRSMCEPLIVGGEVIGAVLVSHGAPMDRPAEECIKTSVVQAAPVLGNLRNLAIAEFRANNDSLTGLPNKRATSDGLKRLVAQAHRAKSPLTAIMVDLDHFKHINDSYGHDMGDEVLAATGAAIASCLRDGDFAGRFGGEEFLVLLPDTGQEDALVAAERLRRTIAAINIPGIDRRISASLGVAEMLGRTGNTGVLLREADRALYSAKVGGRNRTATAWAVDSDGEQATGAAAGSTTFATVVGPRPSSEESLGALDA